ncbi:hypothetical protein RB195_005818 [Necator americanus]|uniref:Uncharacterized protein n=2 Tax=Necator americanus TaxID=51031 RepID=A0ABR1BTI4_NECAM
MRLETSTLLDTLRAALVTFGMLLMASSFCKTNTKPDKLADRRSGESKEDQQKLETSLNSGSSSKMSSSSLAESKRAKSALESDSESTKTATGLEQISKKYEKSDAKEKVNEEKNFMKTQNLIQSHKNVVVEKKRNAEKVERISKEDKAGKGNGAVEQKGLEVKTGEELVPSVIKPVPVDCAALPPWILEEAEGKTQELLPEDEKPLEQSKTALKSGKRTAISIGEGQQVRAKSSELPSKRWVYKPRKPEEYVSLFAGSLTPKLAATAKTVLLANPPLGGGSAAVFKWDTQQSLITSTPVEVHTALVKSPSSALPELPSSGFKFPATFQSKSAIELCPKGRAQQAESSTVVKSTSSPSPTSQAKAEAVVSGVWV